jgi:ACR3 family arsenite efflux pump ArsB
MVFLRMAPPMISFYLLSFGIAWGMARWLRFPREQFVALACTTTARKSPLTLSLAVLFFPAQAVIALSQLIEPVLEIPSLIIFAALLRRRAQSAEALDASARTRPCISGTHRIEGAGERPPAPTSEGEH